MYSGTQITPFIISYTTIEHFTQLVKIYTPMVLLTCGYVCKEYANFWLITITALNPVLYIVLQNTVKFSD